MRLHIATALIAMTLALAGCGGGGDGGTAPPPPPPPPAAIPDPVIGANGGTVTEVSGASIVVPAGTFTTNTTVRIARDSTGAPALPAELTASGSMYVITPHGGDFADGVEVRIPAPAVTLQPNQEFKLAKAQPGGEWLVLEDTALDAGVLTVRVNSFSFFTPVIITYLLPLAQLEPLRIGSTLTCAGGACARSFGTVNATYTVTSNNGQIPTNCTTYSLNIVAARSLNYSSVGSGNPIPITGGALTLAVEQNQFRNFKFGVRKRCGGNFSSYSSTLEKTITWVEPPQYPGLAVLNTPATVDIVDGTTANLDVVFGGGASHSGDQFNFVTAFNRTIIDWERSDNNGASWRVIARSYENEANPWPYTAHEPWYYWSVRHAFVGTIADQSALIRVHACFTPRDLPAPHCVTGSPTRLNVLQQSALPTIVTAPRSFLVRTGQTASLSVVASGLPAPTLVWQTRAANSTGAWSDVTGTGDNTPNYTTTPMALADNGVQYRVVATNAMGSTESAAVSISVSDFAVAPSITTQPASLNVASGSDAVFAVDAHGTEALSYQWYRNGTAVPGANSPVLRLTGVSILNSGTFSVTVSNDAGDADSNAAVLNVYPGTPAAVAPSIVTQPASLTVNVGNTATFAVGVDGSGPFAFQWRRNGINIGGATSAVLTLPAVVSDASGEYSVVVSNAASSGVVSNPAALTVASDGAAMAPSIVTQPSTIVVAPGGSAVLAVAATGSGPLSYQWTFEGAPIGAATDAVLTLTEVDPSEAGTYYVTVSNHLGSEVSTAVDVILLGAPVIFTNPSSVSVFENSTTTFRVDAGGSNRHYQWLRNGSPIPLSDADAYTTPSLTVADSGAVYSVIVYNGAGVVVSGPAVLTVAVPVPPTVLQQPADVSIQAGTTAEICMAFGGTPPFSVQMSRWNGTAWAPVTGRFPIIGNGPFCTLTPPLQLADNGAQYIFFASNAEGGFFEAMTRTVTITVTAPPTITATTLVSRANNGDTANNRSQRPSLSADGNLLAFVSDGTNLVPGFATTFGHAYARNLQTGVTTAVNQTVAGAESTYGVNEMKLAAGGRYVVFSSLAGDLVAGDTNGSQDVFRRDLLTGTTERVNVLANGDELPGTGNGVSEMRLDISADGRFIIWSAFHDMAGGGGELPYMALFIRNMQSHQTTRVVMGDGWNIHYAAISANGEYVAYSVPQNGPVRETVWLYDAEANVTHLLFEMAPANGSDYLGQGMSVSANGRYVAFAMRSVPLLGSTFPQVVVIDRNNPSTLMLASTGTFGSGMGIGNAGSSFPKLSDDGRYVLFATASSNLSNGVAVAGSQAIVLRDLQTQTTSVASRRANGTPVQSAPGVYNSHALSGDGALVAVTAFEVDMTATAGEHQIYMTPRP
jgi:hypothetical protein